jgi:hypothetical protein
MENRRICSGLSGLCLFLASTAASAHELWLDSEKFQYEIGDRVEVSLVNGTQFDGVNLPFFTRRVSELYYSIGTRVDATSRLGDLPAFQQVIDTEGLARFVYVSKIDNITYRGLKKFTAFVEEKDATWALQRHLETIGRQIGLPNAISAILRPWLTLGTVRGQMKPLACSLNSPR